MPEHKGKAIFTILSLLIVLSSCLSQKKFTYFQKKAGDKDTVTTIEAYSPKIQSGDILSIYVNSLSPEASTFFNPFATTVVASDASAGGLSQSAAPGFLVDAAGNISLPLIGTLAVNGLTIDETREKIKKQLETYLKEPTVIVRFLNYKISILGEVNKPGVYVIPNDRVTIPEAIAVAGDLTAFAKRNEIQIIRETNSKKEFVSVDLTDRKVFASPYYYLHSNDIIYVSATKAKVAQGDVALRILPVIVSVATLLVLIFK